MNIKKFNYIVILNIFLFSQVSFAKYMGQNINEYKLINKWSYYEKTKDSANIKSNYPYFNCFQKAAKKYQIPISLLLAIARGESDFNPKAKSSKECYGIMQIRWPGTANDLGIRSKQDLYRPCINIDAGAKYIAILLNRYHGNYYLSVAAYNYGPAKIKKGHVPKGAQWYASYIYDEHLSYILSKPYKKIKRLVILEFSSYSTASKFVVYFKKNIPNVMFEVFKTNRFTYNMYGNYTSYKSKKTIINDIYEKTGVYPIEVIKERSYQ